ncbi:hypothetical protein P171DRAFT_429725 [Karstenula rhodostoma CBS 690.94]|uniref:Uncharacterized protein n=1 Tax=Karstenula rhodostoma CBS 690.94 TaxID=1392251 RepID=A0A9P4PPB5_9PLEO|nr:hypothetical protein P171DRAFT_429725 [Karstenula rhodostoma CBS 690.94]
MLFQYTTRLRPSCLSFRQLSSSYPHRVLPRLIRHQCANLSTETRQEDNYNSKAIVDGLVSKATPFQLPPYLEENRLGWLDDRRFRHGISDYQAERLTVREIAMLALMNSITDKSMWHVKVFDETIVSKWREEVQAMPDSMISDKAFDWCVEELRDKSKDFEQQLFVPTLDSETRCVKSDILISEKLRDDLRQAVEPLLAVSDDEKDWHPNSESKVLNLVHPSLYPLVSGRSRSTATGKVGRETCFESMGEGAIVEPGEKIPTHAVGHGYGRHQKQSQLCSTRFQWLPSEVQFVGDKGTDVKISSYINNLHPIKYKKLYGVIEQMIGKSIPLWNSVLVKGFNQHPGLRIEITEGVTEPREAPFVAEIYEYEDRLVPLAPQIKEYLAQPDNPQITGHWGKDMEVRRKRMELPEDPNEWDLFKVEEAILDVFLRTRTVIHPEPGTSKSYAQWKSSHAPQSIEDEFRAHGLQVIVKLSSIELTPEKPDYAGGSWHLECMLNEGIVATSIFYYDVDNVTDSRIRFSQEACLDETALVYEQSDHDPLSITFGTEAMYEEPAVQELGSLAARQGRIVAFPNTMRHKVEPFSLADKTRPGHRRFLVLWLVDPHFRIMSTADVAPQQVAWAGDARVDGHVKRGLVTLDEAEGYRLELMRERTTLNDAVESNFDSYCLCEH